ncbi:MAG: wax ester/triacylglycerol synthase family O-acyltransferase [Acidimicrobiia bacterium]
MTLRRVEGIDSAFLASETPEWHFHVSALQIVDPSTSPRFGFLVFRELYRQRVHLVPQFHWKLVDPPLGLGWSYFVDDPDFDVDDHLHHIALPAPGDRTELGRLVGDLIGLKIDRRRALWEVWFIDGLEGGRVAILTKIHHAIIDGASGVDVAATLSDLTPEPADTADEPPYEPSRIPSPIEISVRNALDVVKLPLRVARLGRDLVLQGVASIPVVLGKHPPALPFQAPRTPFNGQLTPHRGFASASLPLDVVKQIKHGAGVKLNDVVLAVCSGALRAFLEDRNELPDKPLLAQVPVSTRTIASRGDIGTRVGSMFVSLATNVADPEERLRKIHHGSNAAKELRGALADHRSIGLSDALPPPLFNVAARVWSMAHLDARTPPIYNVIISNVVGPPVDFYVAGARIEAMYPMGPLLYGGGLNITVVSNGDTLDIGLITCRDLLPDPWPLADAFAPALDELATAILGTARSADRIAP